MSTKPAKESRSEPELENSKEPAQDQVHELEEKLVEAEKKYFYLLADLDNYRKRMFKERAELVKFGTESLARELLQVIDNIERALAHMPAATDKTLVNGLHMTLKQFNAVLQNHGIERMSTEGQPFNPELHEAIGKVPSEKPSETILDEVTPGYTLHGRVLRPAKVMISGGASEKSSEKIKSGGEHG